MNLTELQKQIVLRFNEPAPPRPVNDPDLSYEENHRRWIRWRNNYMVKNDDGKWELNYWLRSGDLPGNDKPTAKYHACKALEDEGILWCEGRGKGKHGSRSGYR